MIYIIDFENTSNNFLTGEKIKFKKDDKVYICWENTKSSSLDGSRILDWQNQGVDFEKLIVYGGRNSATDMQFSSWAGLVFGENPKAEITIVSDDVALQGLEDFWKDHKRKLSVINLKDSLAAPVSVKKAVKFTPEKRQVIHHHLQVTPEVAKEDIPSLMKIIKKIEDKTSLQAQCQSTFSGKKGKMYYEIIAKAAGI